MFDYYYCINFRIKSSIYTKNKALYFVPILQSTSSRTFSLIFVFKGQVIYMKDKQIRFVKYGGMKRVYLITYQIHAIIACKLSCCYMSLCILKHNLKVCTIIHYRLYGKNLWFAAISGLQLRVRNRKIIFLFLNQNIMLWVLKRTVSMRQFFRAAPKTYVKTDGYENIYIFTPTNT